MKLAGSAMTTLATLATAAGVGIAGAPMASADNYPVLKNFGHQERLVDDNGGVITGWTVGNRHPSNDTIPYQPRGHLWEADATVRAIRGTVTPIIPDFNARAANGQDYPELGNVATAQGIKPGNVPQGEQRSGKLYFDVVGPNPDGVVYKAGERTLLEWSQ